MKAVIVCVSAAHGNTKRVASAMAEVLEAPVVPPGADLTGYDLIGFGSGIYYGRFAPELRSYVASLPPQSRRAFVFATSGFPTRLHRPLTPLLERKGFEISGTFTCRGLDTWGPFKLVGGIHRGRPTTADLEAARTFALSVGATV